ncbi:hypothetical protein ACLOJK_001990 [Asimina triloba]
MGGVPFPIRPFPFPSQLGPVPSVAIRLPLGYGKAGRRLPRRIGYCHVYGQNLAPSCLPPGRLTNGEESLELDGGDCRISLGSFWWRAAEAGAFSVGHTMCPIMKRYYSRVVSSTWRDPFPPAFSHAVHVFGALYCSGWIDGWAGRGFHSWWWWGIPPSPFNALYYTCSSIRLGLSSRFHQMDGNDGKMENVIRMSKLPHSSGFALADHEILALSAAEAHTSFMAKAPNSFRISFPSCVFLLLKTALPMSLSPYSN